MTALTEKERESDSEKKKKKLEMPNIKPACPFARFNKEAAQVRNYLQATCEH